MNGRTKKQSKIGLHHQKAKTTQQGLGWFHRLEQSFSYGEVQFNTFCPPVEIGGPIAENVYGSSTI